MVSLRPGEGRSRLALFLVAVLIFFVVFEAFCFVGWLAIPFLHPGRQYDSTFLFVFLEIESQVFFLFSFLAPVFVAGLLFSWVLLLPKGVGSVLGKRIRLANIRLAGRKLDIAGLMEVVRSVLDSLFSDAESKAKSAALILSVSVALSFLVAVYPFLLGVDVNVQSVGVDIPYYVNWLNEMDRHETLWQSFSYAFFNISDRPFSLFLMLVGLKAFGASGFQVVQLLPLMLGPLLVLTFFFFLKNAGFNSKAASLGSLFAAFSLHVTVGMFGAFLSNWVALIFLYLGLGFLFLSLNKDSWPLLFVTIVFEVAVLFAHAYTWWMFVGILCVFFVVVGSEWIKTRIWTFQVKAALATLLASMAMGFTRNIVLNFGLFVSEGLKVSQQNLSLLHIQSFWRILNQSLGSAMGISFMNPVLYALAFFGGIVFVFDRKIISRFLASCIVASAIPFVLGTWVVHVRILYNLPIHLFALVGLVFAIKLTETVVASTERKQIGRLLLALAVLLNLNYAIRCSFDLGQRFL